MTALPPWARMKRREATIPAFLYTCTFSIQIAKHNSFRYTASMKIFFKQLLEVVFPDPKKKNCPYCGGGKCFGMCAEAGGRIRSLSLDERREPGRREGVKTDARSETGKQATTLLPGITENEEENE